jgi:hypothetical protein
MKSNPVFKPSSQVLELKKCAKIETTRFKILRNQAQTYNAKTSK